MREARAIMAELAASGLSGEQLTLIMELSASLAIEARPSTDVAAENKRAYDRAYQAERRKNRTTSYESSDANDQPLSPDKSPPDPQKLTPNPDVRDTRAREANPFPRPEWADRQHWSDFLANRKRRRMTNSVTAYRGFLADIARHTDDEWPPGRLLEHAAAKGWGSINDPRGNDSGRRSGNGMGGHQPSDGLSTTTRAAEHVFGIPFGPGERGAVPQ